MNKLTDMFVHMGICKRNNAALQPQNMANLVVIAIMHSQKQQLLELLAHTHSIIIMIINTMNDPLQTGAGRMPRTLPTDKHRT